MLSRLAQKVYEILVSRQRAEQQRVLTYEEVSRQTGTAPIALTWPLGEIFEACDAHEPPLPALTAIVVQKGSSWGDGRYGLPGDGYFKADAESPNRRRRNRDANAKRQVERHQDDVWFYSGRWPRTL